MASDVMANVPSRSLLVPNTLKVKGQGLSPRPTPPSTPDSSAMKTSTANISQSSMSDEDGGSMKSEEYTVLDGVREMNQILVRQIETLRLKIKVDEKNYGDEKNRLVETKDTEIQGKETEIEELKESLTHREERIHQLVKAGREKDKTLQSKCDEIEELKKIVRQTKDYAQRIQKQFGRMRQQKDKLENDPLYQQQNEEIKRLSEELELLKERLVTMETELARAMKVIEQQNEKLATLDSDRQALQLKFREDLERASRAMRQEVERMREVMRQNYEEMRILREQNHEMHDDIRAIKEMLKGSRTSGNSVQNHPKSGTDFQRPRTAFNPLPGYAKQTYGQTTAVAPHGPGKMVGGRVGQSATKRTVNGVKGTVLNQAPPGPTVRDSGQFAARNGRGTVNATSNRVSSDMTTSSSSNNVSSRLSPDTNSKHVTSPHAVKTDNKFMTIHTLNVPDRSSPANKTLPPICTVKEGTPALARQTSGRGAKSAIRRGSALRK